MADVQSVRRKSAAFYFADEQNASYLPDTPCLACDCRDGVGERDHRVHRVVRDGRRRRDAEGVVQRCFRQPQPFCVHDDDGRHVNGGAHGGADRLQTPWRKAGGLVAETASPVGDQPVHTADGDGHESVARRVFGDGHFPGGFRRHLAVQHTRPVHEDASEDVRVAGHCGCCVSNRHAVCSGASVRTLRGVAGGGFDDGCPI